VSPLTPEPIRTKYILGLEFDSKPTRIKCLFDYNILWHAQAFALKNTLRFEEPFREVVNGQERPGVEIVDFIHELTHSYDFRNHRNALSCYWHYVTHKKVMEQRARENEQRWLDGRPLIGSITYKGLPLTNNALFLAEVLSDFRYTLGPA
jgi:hypothetical protein